MVVHSLPGAHLPEYETLVDELVQELRNHRDAASDLAAAADANRDLQARAEALGTMTRSVAERAEIVLTELRTLDAPDVSRRMSAIEQSLGDFLQSTQEASRILLSMKDTLEAATTAVKDSIITANASTTRVTEAVSAATDAVRDGRNATAKSQVVLTGLLETVIDEIRQAKSVTVQRSNALIAATEVNSSQIISEVAESAKAARNAKLEIWAAINTLKEESGRTATLMKVLLGVIIAQLLVVIVLVIAL